MIQAALTRPLAAMALLGLAAAPTLADDLLVPSDDYPTLQAALSAAADGDVIVIGAGTLTGPGNWNLTMPPIALTIRGATGDPADVVWQGEDPYIEITSAMVIGRLSSGTRFEDLTIRGFASPGGGAFNINSAEVEFDNCVIEQNSGAAIDCFQSERGGAFEATSATLRFVDCTIRNNQAAGYTCSGSGGSGTGGVIYGPVSTIVFERCLIEGNAAVGGEFDSARGGVVAGAASVTFIDSVVRDNRAFGDPGSGGVVDGGSVTAINTEFTGNAARSLDGDASGGALNVNRATIVNCRFSRNSGGRPGESFRGTGGALRVFGTVDIVNSVFDNNVASGYVDDVSSNGGAMAIGNGTLTNVTFQGNELVLFSVDRPNAIHLTGGTVELRNCVVNNGSTWLTPAGTASATVVWSCIRGGYPGEGNIDANPMLDAGFRPLPGSPVIDAGNTLLVSADQFDLDGDGDTSEPVPFDLGGQARLANDPATPDTGVPGVSAPVVDMGAFEVQNPCIADLDGDGALTIFDFLEFGTLFDAMDPRADFDGDGAFTVFDFLAFQNAFDAGCP